jgi:hypothetical protein
MACGPKDIPRTPSDMNVAIMIKSILQRSNNKDKTVPVRDILL